MKLIFLHNDMFGEFKKRFPQLREIFDCYHYYDKVISVSKQTSEENKKNLALQYNISEEKFDFLENTIDYNGIIRKIYHMEEALYDRERKADNIHHKTAIRDR